MLEEIFLLFTLAGSGLSRRAPEVSFNCFLPVIGTATMFPAIQKRNGSKQKRERTHGHGQQCGDCGGGEGCKGTKW